jgi:cytochrome c oxidase cbb3-type subunit III
MRLDRVVRRPTESVGLMLIIIAVVCYSQQQADSQKSKHAAHSQSGQQIFATNCSGCHGLDGTGSQRAPNIVSNPQIEKLSSDELHRIISHGVPGTGMPAFQQLGTPAISSLVSYLRSLQGNNKTAPIPGDPKQGEEVFFGSGQCATCHMVAGKGGFIGPDLTSYAETHTPEKIKQAITDPAQRDWIKRVVTAVTPNGEYRGLVLNEDNFSLQLQTMDGNFHFFSKSDLKAISREQNSIMPSDYASKLGESQLDNVVSYLISMRKTSAPVKSDREDGDGD